jgi:hypothetical protein
MFSSPKLKRRWQFDSVSGSLLDGLANNLKPFCLTKDQVLDKG